MRSPTNVLRDARRAKGWTQGDLASRLEVSQGYVSLLEGGQRALPARLRRRVTKLMDLSPANLPLPREAKPLSGDDVARALGRLGYPGFAHLAGGRKLNPAALVTGALLSPELDARLAEALPWVLVRHSDLDWDWLVAQAKLHDLQNRLGFLLTLARRGAKEDDMAETSRTLAERERELERSRLDRDDALSAVMMTEAERRWMQTNRPADAVRWRVLSRLEPETVASAAD